jgi:hypothetical protein
MGQSRRRNLPAMPTSPIHVARAPPRYAQIGTVPFSPKDGAFSAQRLFPPPAIASKASDPGAGGRWRRRRLRLHCHRQSAARLPRRRP